MINEEYLRWNKVYFKTLAVYAKATRANLALLLDGNIVAKNTHDNLLTRYNKLKKLSSQINKNNYSNVNYTNFLSELNEIYSAFKIILRKIKK